jgi:hypothetical protein
MTHKPLPLPPGFCFLQDCCRLGDGPTSKLAALSGHWSALVERYPVLNTPFSQPPAEAWGALRRLLNDLEAFGKENGCIVDSRHVHERPMTDAEFEADLKQRGGRSTGSIVEIRAKDPAEEIREALRHQRIAWELSGVMGAPADYAASIDGLRDLWRKRIGHPPAVRRPASHAEVLDALDLLERKLDKRFPASPQGQPPTQASVAARDEGGPAAEEARPKRKRGRKPDTDQKKDERLWDAWRSGEYKTLTELGKEFRMTKREVERALDRHRKRLPKGRQRSRQPE